MCVYVYMYVCVYVYVCTCICVYACMCVVFLCTLLLPLLFTTPIIHYPYYSLPLLFTTPPTIKYLGLPAHICLGSFQHG